MTVPNLLLILILQDFNMVREKLNSQTTCDRLKKFIDQYLILVKLLYFSLNVLCYSTYTYTNTYANQVWQVENDKFGYILGLGAIGFTGSLFWTWLADRWNQTRLIVMMASIGYCTSFFLLRLIPIETVVTLSASFRFVYFSVAYGMCNFFTSAMYPLLDRRVFQILSQDKRFSLELFGRQRLFGTLGQSFITLVNGFAIDKFGFDSLFVSLIVSTLVFLLLVANSFPRDLPPSPLLDNKLNGDLHHRKQSDDKVDEDSSFQEKIICKTKSKDDLDRSVDVYSEDIVKKSILNKSEVDSQKAEKCTLNEKQAIICMDNMDTEVASVLENFPNLEVVSPTKNSVFSSCSDFNFEGKSAVDDNDEEEVGSDDMHFTNCCDDKFCSLYKCDASIDNNSFESGLNEAKVNEDVLLDEKESKGSILLLMRNIVFLHFLVCVLITGIARSVVGNFLHQFLRESLKISHFKATVVTQTKLVSEILFFFFGKQMIARFGTHRVFLAAQLSGLVRVCAYCLMPIFENHVPGKTNIPWLFLPIFVEALKGINNACLLSAGARIAHDCAPRGCQSLAQGFFSGVNSYLSISLAGILSGVIFHITKSASTAVSYHQLFVVTSALAFLGIVIYSIRIFI